MTATYNARGLAQNILCLVDIQGQPRREVLL